MSRSERVVFVQLLPSPGGGELLEATHLTQLLRLPPPPPVERLAWRSIAPAGNEGGPPYPGSG